MHELLGKEVVRRQYRRAGEQAGHAVLIVEEARRGRHVLCPGGPVLDWRDEDLVADALADIARVGRDHDAVFVRVRPQVTDSFEVRKLLEDQGYRRAPMHLEAETSWELDIGPDEEALLAEMDKDTRYAIRKSTREGVEVEISLDPSDADDLYDLQMKAVQRHDFVPFSRDYFRAHAEAFLPDQLIFFKAYWQEELWAVAMIVFYEKTAIYHYAGSRRSPRGVSPPSLILWEAIKEAKKRGCDTFNFWGVSPDDDPDHRFAGVTRFKKGFGGKRVFYVPAHDKPLSVRYWPVYGFETVRRWRRGL